MSPSHYFPLLYVIQPYSGYPHAVRSSLPEVSLTLLPLAVCYTALQRLPTRCKIFITRSLTHTTSPCCMLHSLTAFTHMLLGLHYVKFPSHYFLLLYVTQPYSGYPHAVRSSIPEVSLTLLPPAVCYTALQRLPTFCKVFIT